MRLTSSERVRKMNVNMDCPILIRHNVNKLNLDAVGDLTGCDVMSKYPTRIYLNKKKITVGRSPNVDCCILSKNVSRVHAVIKVASNGDWFCTDNNSLNGSFMNGAKIKAEVPVVMRPGDVVRFGAEMSDPINVFVFRLPSTKRGCEQDDALGAGGGGGGSNCVDDAKKRAKQTELIEIDDPCHHEDKDVKIKIVALEAELETLKKENEMMRRKEEEFESKNTEHERRLKVFNRELNETKEQLRLTTQKTTKLKERMSELLTVTKKRDEETNVKMSKLESALNTKEEECKVLQELIDDADLPKSLQITEKNMTTAVINILEAELQCSVCNELFVKALTLSCSHTFCSQCIAQWTRKKNDCPICRLPVVTFAPSLVIDAFIDKLVDFLGSELKSRRLDTIAERKQSILEPVIAGASVASISVPGPSRRSLPEDHGGRSSASGRAILISSADESSSSEADFSYDDESMDESNPRAYYGGYGSCYVCGGLDHWANSCRYR